MDRRIRLCIVNRNYPPQRGATGEQAAHLLEWLKKDIRLDIQIVSVRNEVDRHPFYFVKERYSGKSKIRRLFSALIESLELIRKTKSLRPDISIIMTDPPFLNFWAAKLLKNSNWINWTMDLYPDAFVANGLVTKNNIFLKYYMATLKRHCPKHLICLGQEQFRYLQKNYADQITHTILPAGLREDRSAIPTCDDVPHWFEQDKIIIGYVGSIGEAHDASAIIDLVKRLIKDQFKFILSCYGSKSKEVVQLIGDLPGVVCLDYLPQQQMSLLDIQIVTLLPRWTHICVPSKALSALSYHNAILFIGEQASDTWQYVRSAGWHGDTKEELGQILNEVRIADVKERRIKATRKAKSLMQERDQAYADILQKILTLTDEIS